MQKRQHHHHGEEADNRVIRLGFHRILSSLGLYSAFLARAEVSSGHACRGSMTVPIHPDNQAYRRSFRRPERVFSRALQSCHTRKTGCRGRGLPCRRSGPSVSRSFAISSSNSAAPIGSRPEVGSSRKTSAGIERQRAGERRALDHAAGQLATDTCRRLRAPGRPARSSAAPVRPSAACGRLRYSRIGNWMFSFTVSGREQRAVLEQHAELQSSSNRSLSAAGCRSRCPAARSCRPGAG